jgi:GLPGLI family protein
MKKILFLFCLLASFFVNAQVKEGKVIYERTMQMQRPRDMDEEMARMIPPSRKDNFELLFGNNQSIWQVIPNPDGDNNTFTGGGGNVVVRMAGNNDVIYHDFATAKRTDQRELFEKEFLVTDSIRKLSWKLSEETKTVLDRTVRKATSQRINPRMQMTMENGEMKRQEVMDTSNIVAWFTSDITVPAGPQEFQGQLPGLILELNINNGRTIYKAVELSAKINASNIKEPKGGKRITADEFTKEREKLMEEMRRNNPGGNRIIRMN